MYPSVKQNSLISWTIDSRGETKLGAAQSGKAIKALDSVVHAILRNAKESFAQAVNFLYLAIDKMIVCGCTATSL